MRIWMLSGLLLAACTGVEGKAGVGERCENHSTLESLNPSSADTTCADGLVCDHARPGTPQADGTVRYDNLELVCRTSCTSSADCPTGCGCNGSGCFQGETPDAC